MPSTVQDLQRARIDARRPFLAAGKERRTFGEVSDLVARAARELRMRGIVAGDRVALLLPRGVDEAVWLLAIMAAGAVAVPIHAKLKDDQVRHVLRDAEPVCCVTSAARTVALRDPVEALSGVATIAPQAGAAPGGAGGAGEELQVDVAGADVAVLLYTSGSTGPAKGILQTHENLVRGAEIVAGYLGIGPDDHLLGLLSLSFDYGLNQLTAALLCGAQLTLAEHLGVGELAALLRAHRPTGIAGVPSLWSEVAAGLASGALCAADGACLRYLTNSGGALREEDAVLMRRAWPEVDVFAMYGLTEAFRSAFLPPAELAVHPTSFGYAIDGVELLLVCPRTGDVLEGAAVGELVHAGALVARGYWRRPEADARRFRPDPRGRPGRVVYSGDLVRRDADGRHYFVSRMDRMLKVQGHRVSPDEVAQAVVGVDGVGEVAVLGVGQDVAGDRVALCCVGDPADGALLQQLRRRCRARLPSYMQPAVLRVVASLPRNANGKLDEAALRGMLG
jgi:acyl-CoA synthetase (AMP-forming)/AMP-acid ligase II